MRPSSTKGTNVQITPRTGERMFRIGAELEIIRKRLAFAGLHAEANACAVVRSKLEDIGNQIIEKTAETNREPDGPPMSRR